MRAFATASICLSILAGCSEPSYSNYSAAPTRVDSLPSSPSIKNDGYSPSIEVETAGGKRGGGTTTEIYGLYGKIDRASGKAAVYVQWSEIYTANEWRFFNRASSSKGQSYEFTTVGRDVQHCSRYSGCIYSEVYNIYIPSPDARAGSKDGISFKIYGKNGDERIVSLPADLVASFNEKMAEAAKLRTKS